MQGSVRKRGTAWSYYFDLGIVDGKRKRKEKGGFRTKAEAQEALRTALNEFEKGGITFDESNISVADYFDYWFKEYVLINCKYNTQQAYKVIIENHIKPTMGNYKLKSLNPAMLQEFINGKYKNGYTKHSIANFFGVLSCALKLAVYPYKLIKENPMAYVNIPKMKNTKQLDDFKIISLKDFKTIIARFPKESSFYIPLQVAFNTGMRASEVCGLTWDNIDFKNKTITVEKITVKKGLKWCFGTPKTESSARTISIGDTLVEILKEHKEWQDKNVKKYNDYYANEKYVYEELNKIYYSKDLVSTKENGELISTESLKYLSRVVNYDLGISFNFHSLRHTHATMLLEAGANIKDIQRRLGHSKLSTTMDTYSHVTQKMKENSVSIFESILATNL